MLMLFVRTLGITRCYKKGYTKMSEESKKKRVNYPLDFQTLPVIRVSPLTLGRRPRKVLLIIACTPLALTGAVSGLTR